ncbi:DsbA family oxidoreductase [Haloarchaeobius baliensis]|uniref:DsbA family oxidoreductase n=1 Tax=Haloarchaeobius baliensis TaxID=1670458 RepID=UPI003F8842DC
MTREHVDSVTVYADYVCPFCYLGRHALSLYQDTRAEPLRVEWRPFDLRAAQRGPDGELDLSVDDGKDEAYYERARQGVERLREKYGVEMTVDVSRDVDSLQAQLLSRYVQEREPYDTWRALDEALLAALWRDGRDIGDPDVLVDVAAEVGLDEGVVETALSDDANRDALAEDFAAAKAAGVTGVPTFVHDGHQARGAVPPEQLERLVEGV